MAPTIKSLDFNQLIDTKQSKSIGINHEWDCQLSYKLRFSYNIEILCHR